MFLKQGQISYLGFVVACLVLYNQSLWLLVSLDFGLPIFIPAS